MLRRELTIVNPEGQASFRKVDTDLLRAALAGRRVAGQLSRFGSGESRVRGVDLFLDDDTVFTYRHRAVENGSMSKRATAEDQGAMPRERKVVVSQELGCYVACAIMLDGQRVLEHRILKGE